eukprot:m.121124 g.121124  ORF g.121124 m.121124 type:complete len:516 (-) comp13703_c0_seq1:135-1682(-)
MRLMDVPQGFSSYLMRLRQSARPPSYRGWELPDRPFSRHGLLASRLQRSRAVRVPTPGVSGDFMSLAFLKGTHGTKLAAGDSSGHIHVLENTACYTRSEQTQADSSAERGEIEAARWSSWSLVERDSSSICNMISLDSNTLLLLNRMGRCYTWDLRRNKTVCEFRPATDAVINYVSCAPQFGSSSSSSQTSHLTLVDNKGTIYYSKVSNQFSDKDTLALRTQDCLATMTKGVQCQLLENGPTAVVSVGTQLMLIDFRYAKVLEQRRQRNVAANLNSIWATDTAAPSRSGTYSRERVGGTYGGVTLPNEGRSGTEVERSAIHVIGEQAASAPSTKPSKTVVSSQTPFSAPFSQPKETAAKSAKRQSSAVMSKKVMGKVKGYTEKVQGHRKEITSLISLPHGRILSCAGREMRISCALTGQTKYALLGSKSSGVSTLTAFNNGMVLQGSVDGVVRVWTSKPPPELPLSTRRFKPFAQIEVRSAPHIAVAYDTYSGSLFTSDCVARLYVTSPSIPTQH